MTGLLYRWSMSTERKLPWVTARWCWLLTAVTFMLCPPAEASSYICWIDRVVVADSGIRVFFSPAADIWGRMLPLSDTERRFTVKAGHVIWPDHEEAGLLIKTGEASFVVGGENNTCDITPAVVNGHGGLTARANFSAPGLKSHAEKFIPAT